MLIKTLWTSVCLSMLCISPAGAETPSWLVPYLSSKGAEKPGPKSRQAVVQHRNTRVLLTSERLQTLSGQPGTIGAARILAALTTRNVPLPDGTTLGDIAGDWALAPLPEVSLYRVTYRAPGPRGQATKLSGLVVVPEAGSSPLQGILVYMHATTTQQNDAPSDRSQEAYAAMTAFADSSHVLAMPDYLGYGVNHGNHPYAMGERNAPSGRGIILAARELMKQLKRPVGEALLITGYSEGGGNALGLSRFLEARAEPGLWPTRSAPMSGPYDLSGATALSFIGAQPPLSYQENFTSKPTLLSFAGVSTARIIHQPLDTLLKEPLAQEARRQLPGRLSESSLGSRLLTTVVDQLGYVDLETLSPNPENLLNPSLVTAIRTQDVSNPAMALWAQNNTVDWIPRTPVLLLGILQDELVPFAGTGYPIPPAWNPLKPAAPPYAQGNAQNVITAMRKKGIGRDRVGWTAFNGAVQSLTQPVTMSHADGLLPCSILAQAFLYHPNTPIPQLADPSE